MSTGSNSGIDKLNANRKYGKMSTESEKGPFESVKDVLDSIASDRFQSPLTTDTTYDYGSRSVLLPIVAFFDIKPETEQTARILLPFIFKPTSFLSWSVNGNLKGLTEFKLGNHIHTDFMAHEVAMGAPEDIYSLLLDTHYLDVEKKKVFYGILGPALTFLYKDERLPAILNEPITIKTTSNLKAAAITGWRLESSYPEGLEEELQKRGYLDSPVIIAEDENRGSVTFQKKGE